MIIHGSGERSDTQFNFIGFHEPKNCFLKLESSFILPHKDTENNNNKQLLFYFLEY